MKRLIFILLKIAEVILAFSFVWVAIYKPFFGTFINLLENLLGLWWVLVLNNIVLFWCLYNLVKRGHFKAWIQSNKKWSQNIVNWLKRVKRH